MKKGILIIIGVVIIGIDYFGLEIFGFSNRVKEDKQKAKYIETDKDFILISDSISPNEKYKYYEYQFDNGGLGYSRIFWSVTKNDNAKKNLFDGKIPDGYKIKGWSINNELILEKWEPYYYKAKEVELTSNSIFKGVKIIVTEKQNKTNYKMTVILHDNQNPNSEWTEKMLVKDSIISVELSLIDVYFCNKISRLPYYLPTNGVFRDSIKDNECNMEIYPANVKCYDYDNKGRVINMSVNGSGTMGDWAYKYDSLDRIIEIQRFSTTYTVHYKGNQHLLTELIVDGGAIQKRIEIQYKIQ